ncbi:unnamed protein product [Peniophora sp. CBMAI 1063]|nr:unnamed protein product [Peniophora sp. CBMAI 1063]
MGSKGAPHKMPKPNAFWLLSSGIGPQYFVSEVGSWPRSPTSDPPRCLSCSPDAPHDSRRIYLVPTCITK